MSRENTLRTVLWYATGNPDRTQPGYYLLINVMMTIMNLGPCYKPRARPASCCRCRRDREQRSCYRCPELNWRNWRDSLELSAYAAVAMVFILIPIFYRLGIS